MAKKNKAKKSIKKSKKSKVITTKVIKQKPISKKHVLDDIEEDELNVDLPELDANLENQEISSDDEVIDDIETVNAIADPLETIEDLETFSLAGSTGDGEGQLETVRSNPKPKPGWTDKVKPKFSPGDLVVPIELTKKEALEFEPWKIACPDVHKETYSVKKSRVLSEVVVYGDEIKLAPKNGKPFVTHWEANNPFKVAGVKISCPSNNK
jgi:hypothetical protein